MREMKIWKQCLTSLSLGVFAQDFYVLLAISVL
jgi:hypothetical protein